MVLASQAWRESDRVHSCPLIGALLAFLLLLVPSRSALGQVTILSETFEGNFPADNGWAVGDANLAGTPAYWDDVYTTFGGAGTHGGAWKGYCAGIGYGGTSSNPTYQDSMRAFMRRSIDLYGLCRGRTEVLVQDSEHGRLLRRAARLY